MRGRIQGTLEREDSKNIQGTFREHSGNIQRTFREQAERNQGGIREESGRIQATWEGGFREHERFKWNLSGRI